MKTILVVGGTGAQGSAVVRILSSTGNYHILLFTRDTTSSHAQTLLALPNVKAVSNPASQGYDLEAFEAAARKSYGVFLNTDGFSIGEQAETFWGIRLYETALKAGVKHVVYSGLDDNYRNTNYDERYYVGHFQGKARVQAYIRDQPRNKTAWTITRSGPYIEMLSESLIPQHDVESDTYIFTFPLDEGAVVLIHLEDYGRYVDWIFSNPIKSAFMDLGIGISHSTGKDVAEAFTAVTGKPAVYRNVPVDAWSEKAFARFPQGAETKVGFRSTQDQSTLTVSYRENFEKFWNLWKGSARNKGVVKRDYGILDEILPGRVRSVQDWMERTGYTGERIGLLKSW